MGQAHLVGVEGVLPEATVRKCLAAHHCVEPSVQDALGQDASGEELIVCVGRQRQTGRTGWGGLLLGQSVRLK